jgi:Tfp pilus assembly protein PilX
MHRLNNNRGSTLAITLILLFVLAMLGEAILNSSISENRSARRYSDSSKAFWLADAGVQKVVYEYSAHGCQGLCNASTSAFCTNCACGGADKRLATRLGSSSNDYSCSSSNGAVTGAYGDYNVTIDYLNTVKITGYYPSRTSSSAIKRSITLVSDSPMRYAAFAKGKVTISNGVKVDSYNSNAGAYGGANILSHGNVGSNGTASNSIDLGNNSKIFGDASTGSGGGVLIPNSAVITDMVTGSVTHTNSQNLANVVVPSGLTSLSSGGTLTVNNNQTGSLSAGSYKYDSINLKNGSTLNINGTVNLYLTSATSLTTGNNVILNINSGAKLNVYVDGVFTFNNNMQVNNTAQVPGNLYIRSTYTGTSGINLSNNNTTYAAVYAPNTDVLISNNGDFYGAVIGKTITLAGSSNSFVHFDQVLGGGGNGLPTNWQECNPNGC